MLFHPQAGEHIFAIQPALGMGNQVHLLGVFPLENAKDKRLELLGVVLNGAKAVGIRRVNAVSRLFQNLADVPERLYDPSLL